jgi:PAS domain S-box-containing protein
MNSGDRIDQGIETPLDFERVLFDISARFVSTPTDQLSEVIDDTLRRICEYLDCDIAALWRWSADAPLAYVLTNLHRRFEGLPVPELFDAREFFPWTLEMNLRGETLVYASLDEVPPEGARDKESWIHFGIKSNLSCPLSVAGGGVLGSFTLSMVREERAWPENLVTRLHLVAQICANALARARVENALKESEARLSLAVESAEAVLWSWDIESDRIWTTDMARDLYGNAFRNLMMYQEFVKTIHPDDREFVQKKAEQAFRTQANFRAEYRIVLANGDIRWIASFGRPYYKASGKPDRMMGVTLDVTSRRQREMEVHQLRLEVGHATRITMFGELSASLVHELNQPLAAILNNAEAAKLLLASGNPDLEQIREAVEDIISDDKRAAEVIRKARGLVKKSELCLETLDIIGVISEVLDMIRSELILQKVDLEWEAPSSSARVKGDRIHLQQVLLNLTLNAIEAMKGALIRRLTVRTLIGLEEITVSVSDTGTGVDEEAKDVLFKPFFTTKKEGLGMGLHICRTIIQAHGGKVWISNNPDGGATFSFSLAVADEAGTT